MIEFEIKNRSSTPPQGWKYTQPESGATFAHYDYITWKNSILSHRKANNYPIPDDFEDDLVNEACKQNPHWPGSVCKRLASPRGHARKKLGWKEAFAFLRVLEAFVKQGGALVDQEEANRRAEICARCPKNIPIASSCGACETGLRSLLKFLIRDKKTWADAEIESCGVCGCNLKASVWFPLEVQQQGLSEEQKAEFRSIDYCWKRSGL
jgi:hypothetical protein